MYESFCSRRNSVRTREIAISRDLRRPTRGDRICPQCNGHQCRASGSNPNRESLHPALRCSLRGKTMNVRARRFEVPRITEPALRGTLLLLDGLSRQSDPSRAAGFRVVGVDADDEARIAVTKIRSSSPHFRTATKSFRHTHPLILLSAPPQRFSDERQQSLYELVADTK
jgi:hypothetical protein